MVDKTSLIPQERSLLLVQIRYLEDELERYELTYEELEKQNKELLSHYNKLENEKRVKTEHLKRLVAAKEKKVKELREQLMTQHLTAKLDRKSLQQEHSRMKQELQEQINELQAKLGKQAVALEQNEKHIMELKQQVLERGSEEVELSKKKTEHEAIIHSLKRNAELDSEKLIQYFQDYKEYTENTEAEMLLANGRACHRKQLSIESFLRNEESTLKEKISDLQRRQGQLRSTGQGLMRKIISLRPVQNLNEKDVNLLKKTFQELKEEQDEWMNKQEVTLTENEALSQQISRVSKKSHQKEANIQRLEEELERETNRRKHLEEVKEEAVIILRHILMCPEDLPEAQWKIWRLVEILNTAAPQRTGLTSNNSRRKASRGQKLHSSNPESLIHHL
ncbi:hypothetical protein CHARACLAT_013120 [Characodon lateralis]|uniref:Cilia- and flagella-associated protein 157 n=1 Tax=Characodon lateralis TaxID=208331 RepID=A0ABU7CZH9_9TELE|nr:hypothetical protein [Characodon lateralis]